LLLGEPLRIAGSAEDRQQFRRWRGHRLAEVVQRDDRLERVAAWVRTVDPTLPTPPRLVGRAIVAASWELMSQAIRTPGDTTADSREALAYVWLLGLTGRPQLTNQRRPRGHQENCGHRLS
jgi:hypothetical protein